MFAPCKVTFPIEKTNIAGNYVKIEISGLLGGHSGVEINKQRANANKLLGRLLLEISKSIDMNIVKISGGSKLNAIPRNAFVGITIKSTDDLRKLNYIYDTFLNECKDEYRVSDPNLNITINKNVKTSSAYEFSSTLTKNLIDFLVTSPDGVQTMSNDIKGLVQSSLNLAVIESTEENINILLSIRSSVHSLQLEISNRLSVLATLCNSHCENIGEYPEWQYDPNSKIRKLCIDTYKNLYKEEPKITAIHAGFECGLFKKTMRYTDMISFGPDITDPHTPNEHLNLESAKRVWFLLLEILKNLK